VQQVNKTGKVYISPTAECLLYHPPQHNNWVAGST